MRVAYWPSVWIAECYVIDILQGSDSQTEIKHRMLCLD